MDDRNAEAITLDFETRVRVAGEAICGHVHINHPLAEEDKIEQVIVKLIGRIKTYADLYHYSHRAAHGFLFFCASVPSQFVMAMHAGRTGRRFPS
jgi:hypothetical protein